MFLLGRGPWSLVQFGQSGEVGLWPRVFAPGVFLLDAVWAILVDDAGQVSGEDFGGEADGDDFAEFDALDGIDFEAGEWGVDNGSEEEELSVVDGEDDDLDGLFDVHGSWSLGGCCWT